MVKNSLTPYVTIEGDRNMIQVDVFSTLMKERIMYFGREVNADTCNIAISQLLYMYSEDKTSPISIYINTPGGDVYSGLALYDTMKMISKTLPLTTICVGLAASMGSILISAGTRGHRLALPHSRVMIHQPLSGTGGMTQASDIEIVARETNILKQELSEILAEASGKTVEEIIKDCDRDNWLKAGDCLPGKFGKFGLIDKIITEIP